MENTADKIQEMLSDEDSMRKLQMIYEIFSKMQTQEQPVYEEDTGSFCEKSDDNIFDDSSECDGENTGFDFGMIFKLQEIMSGTGENKNTVLLNALKPYLSEEKQKKTEKAIKIMNILDAVDILKESGILGDIIE